MEERDYAKEYGNRCRQIRMAKGISQQALADMMNTTPQNVSKWEKHGIKNVNDVMKLSEVLGQDITADQIDQEGSVGEIGQEILAVLIRNNGYIEFDELVSSLYGMSVDRVASELFKLERIGNVIREQYTDYNEERKDGVFITAKGMITIKNIKVFGFSEDVLNNCYSYERNLDHNVSEERYRNIQEKVDDDKLSKLLWKLSFAGAYRVDYICYLMRKYRAGIPVQKSGSINAPFGETLITGENAFIDLLYRMALGITNGYYPEHLMQVYGDWYDLETERTELHRKLSGFDKESFAAQCYFEDHFSWIIHDDTKLTAYNRYIPESEIPEDMEEDYHRFRDLDSKLWSQLEDDFEFWGYEDFKGLFHEYVPVEREERCLEWFDKETIEEFIKENFRPASTEKEKEIDRIIAEINTRFPYTLDYFYHFPKEWEENGLAQMIRSVWNIPEHVKTEA